MAIKIFKPTSPGGTMTVLTFEKLQRKSLKIISEDFKSTAGEMLWKNNCSS